MLSPKRPTFYALVAAIGVSAAQAFAEPAPVPAAAPDDTAEKTRRAEVVATFEGGQVTVGDLEDQIAAQAPFMRDGYKDPAALAALLDKTIRFEVLAREAVRRGYDKNDVVSYAVKQNAVQTLIREEFDEKLKEDSIPAEDVKKYYEEHLAEFVRPALRRASQLLVATEAEAKAVLAEAKAADMRAFRELTRNKSTDQETRLRGGDLRYFDDTGKVHDETAPAVDPALAKAAFALKTVGDTSAPIKTERGFVIVRLTGLRDAHAETLEQADETIRARLARDRRQAGIDALLQKLRAELKPEVHPELVDAIKLDSHAVMPTAPARPQAAPVAPQK
jgi:peptidyl-prolyl cis-trans isomerase C